MQTHPSDKQLVTVLGIAVGAGIALTFLCRSTNKKVRTHPANTHPQWTHLVVTRAPAQTRVPEREVAPCNLPPTPPTPVVESITPRWPPGLLDTLIVLFAFCISVGISLALSVNAPIDRFDVVILTCSFVLIATFYDFLFKTAGCGTPGETWQKASHFG